MAIADDSGAFQSASRRYDLDWLRVIAFGLLIFYHVGMFYVSWGWHVKSVYAGPAGEPAMLMVNPWRLALLFFISGAAVRFASDKTLHHFAFARSRLYRLGMPIVFGVIVLVAPQSYFELRQAGAIEPGYLAFWGDYLRLDQRFAIITPTWNHLWYVVYLLVYILLITPFLPAMQIFAQGAGARLIKRLLGGPVRLLFVAIIPFVVYEYALSPHFPTTHTLVGDWANHAHRLTIFLLGFLVAKNMAFWRSVDRALVPAALLVLGIGASRLYLRAHHADLYGVLFDEFPIMPALIVLYSWSFIVMALGAAQRWLNRPSATLRYFTGAVFCYYILHQTIIVGAGYYLTPLKLGAWTEFSLVMAITIAGCAAGYEIARRLPGVALVLGIKRRAAGEARCGVKSQPARSSAGAQTASPAQRRA